MKAYDLVFDRYLLVSGCGMTAVLAQVVGQHLDADVVHVPVKTDDSSSIEQVKDAAIPQGSEVIIGVGGGKALDVAKLAAGEMALPYIAIPTMLSNDGVASPIAVIRHGGVIRRVTTALHSAWRGSRTHRSGCPMRQRFLRCRWRSRNARRS